MQTIPGYGHYKGVQAKNITSAPHPDGNKVHHHPHRHHVIIIIIITIIILVVVVSNIAVTPFHHLRCNRHYRKQHQRCGHHNLVNITITMAVNSII